MTLIYTVGIFLFRFILGVLAPFNPKALQMLKGRKGWRELLKENISKQERYIWFHCSSLGEFEQGRPLIEAYKSDFPDKKIILTFYSPSGYELRKNYSGADLVMYMPFDTRRNARFFIQTVNPETAYFIKYDFWYYFLKALKKNKVDTYLVSAIFRKNQLFFKWYGGWYRNILDNFSQLFVQNVESGQLLNTINKTNWIVAGDTRFDRVRHLPATPFNDTIINAFCENHRIIVCGSTWLPDEQLLAEWVNLHMPIDVKLIIIPHEIGERHLSQLDELFKPHAARYSATTDSDAANKKIIVVDAIGKLSLIYRYGIVAYIGGGFGIGIHNTLEAAIYGIPIMFGPNYHKFKEARDLIECGAAKAIKNGDEFTGILNKLLVDSEALHKSGKTALHYVNGMTGATDKILQYIKNRV